MFNSFGRSFREEFFKLKGKLFRKVDKLTLMLFLTATCNKQIKASFQNMIGVAITDVEWRPASEMENRKVSLYCIYSSNPLRRVLNGISETLLSPGLSSNKTIVYSNTRKRVEDIMNKTGAMLDGHRELSYFDVISVYSMLPKELLP